MIDFLTRLSLFLSLTLHLFPFCNFCIFALLHSHSVIYFLHCISVLGCIYFWLVYSYFSFFYTPFLSFSDCILEGSVSCLILVWFISGCSFDVFADGSGSRHTRSSHSRHRWSGHQPRSLASRHVRLRLEFHLSASSRCWGAPPAIAPPPLATPVPSCVDGRRSFGFVLTAFHSHIFLVGFSWFILGLSFFIGWFTSFAPSLFIFPYHPTLLSTHPSHERVTPWPFSKGRRLSGF